MKTKIEKLAATALVSAALAIGGATTVTAQSNVVPSADDRGVNEGPLTRPASKAAAELSAPKALSTPDAGALRFLAAAVEADGTFATSRRRDSTGVISAARISTGAYEVITNYRRLHIFCWYTASVADRDAGTNPPGIVNIDARAGTNNGLFIEIRDPDGNLVDLPFNVVIYCNN